MQQKTGTQPTADETAQAVFAASRVFVAMAARSLGPDTGGVTLPQFRALVALSTTGPTRLVDLAADLSVAPSTAGRMCDRLERMGLLQRSRSTADRREVSHELTARGQRVVRRATRKRELAIAAVVARIPAAAQAELVRALRGFVDAANRA